MGVAISSCYNYTKRHKTARRLRAKIQLLEEELKEMRRGREQEGQACEQQVAAFARKEEEWRQQRRKQQEENARVRLRLAEEEEKVKRLEKAAAEGATQGAKEWQEFGTGYVVEQMKIEQARREEAVEKWKQLYLAIKTELDDLIQRTHQTNGERYCWRAEQGVLIEELKKELASKEEAMASLKEKMQQVEKEGMRREREIDILRQSLRILSSSKRERSSRSKKCINSRGSSLRTG